MQQLSRFPVVRSFREGVGCALDTTRLGTFVVPAGKQNHFGYRSGRVYGNLEARFPGTHTRLMIKGGAVILSLASFTLGCISAHESPMQLFEHNILDAVPSVTVTSVYTAFKVGRKVLLG